MTKRILSLLSLGLLLAAPAANAALVNIATNTLAGGSRLVVTSADVVFPLGSIVRIGTFNGGAPSVTPTSTFATLNAQFVPIGENSLDAKDGTNGPLVTNTNAAGGAGWSGTINSVDNSDARFAAGTKLFLFVLNAPPATMGDATEALILSDAAWTIPTSGARTMTTAQIDAAGEVFLGTWGATQLKSAFIGTVPEPSTSAVALLVGVGLIARRRRR